MVIVIGKTINSLIFLRSPYSNEFFPPLLKPMLPSPTIRIFEEKAQLLFGEYLKLYAQLSLIQTKGIMILVL
jgi:F-actin capping protein, beta subunit.